MDGNHTTQPFDATPAGSPVAPPLDGPAVSSPARGGPLSAGGIAGLDTIKALSLCQPYASLLVTGIKTIETRRWATPFRGKLLICASKRELGSVWDLARWDQMVADRLARALWGRDAKPGDRLPTGVAVGVVNLVNCKPMGPGDWAAACCEPYQPAYGFVCQDAYRVREFPVKGQLGLWNHPVTQRQLERVR